MENQINILHLEDNETDAFLIQITLKKSGIIHQYQTVDNKNDFIDYLNNNSIDIVLSDYSLPEYSGKEALEHIKTNYPQIPFVFVSGTMGEEAAIDSLVNGATDYVLKNRIEKLPSAVTRAIKESKLAKEYQEAIEELKQSEEKYRTLINGMNEGLIMADNDDRILFVNKQFCEIIGYKANEIIGEIGYKIFQKEDDHSLISEKTKLRQTGIKDTYEVKMKRKDGSEIWIKISGSPWLDQNNNVIGSISVFENINESKIAQLEFKKQQDLLQTIIDSTPDLIFYKDLNSNYLGCNKAFEKFSNRSKEDQIGKNDFDFFDKETATLFRQKDQEIFKNKKTLINEEWVVYPNGEKILLETIKTPLFDTENNIIGLVGVSRNITERYQKEQEILERKLFTESLINAIPLPIFYKDKDCNYLGINTSFENYYGKKSDKIIGKTVFDIAKKEFAQIYHNKDIELIKNGGIQIYETQMMNMSNEIRDCVYHKATFSDSDNNLKGIIGVILDITDLRKTEKLLTESQELFKNLAMVSPVGIFRTDSTGFTTYVNPKWTELSGIDAHEAYGNGWYNAVHPEDRDKLNNKWEKDTSKSIISEAEYRFLKPDGSIVWVMGKAVPEIKEDEMVGYIGTITDITDRKKSEINLKENEEKFRQIFENNPLGVLHFNKFGILTACNDVLIEIMGSSRNKLIGINLLKLKNALIVNQIKKTLNNEKSYYEGEYVSITGSKKTTIKTYFSPIINIDNTNNGGLAIIEDITEKIKAERTIFLQGKALDAAANAIVITDYTGSIEWVNPAFEQLTGFKLNEVIGKNPREVVKSDEHSKDFYSDLWNTILTGKPWHGEMINRKKDGSLYFEEQIITPIIDQNNEITHFVAIKQDISERKKTEQDLLIAKDKAEASDRLKSAFMNNISHEIRTPLNGILGFGQMLCEPDLSDEEKNHYMMILQGSSDRLINTVTDYIDISLISTGNQDVKSNTFFIKNLIKKISITNEIKCKNKNLYFVTSLPDDYETFTLETDENLLFKILNHITDNAIKFTQKGAISFGYKVKNHNIDFFVKDTGIGINMDNISNLFNYFMQEDTSMTRGYEGSGLGLAIAKGFVNLLNGSIKVESEKGKGSTFYVSIPLIKNKEIKQKDNKITLNQEISKPLVLIAEDDDDNYFLLETLFEKSEISFIRAYNGIEAVEYAKQFTDISLILMDLKMPKLNGFEATKQIKAFNKNIPIIAVTAYALTGDDNRAFEAGCDDYIEKPIRRALLIEKLNNYGIKIK